jgi:hypothetical protein
MIYAIKLGELLLLRFNAEITKKPTGKTGRDVLNISPCSSGFRLLMLILSEFSTKMVRVDGFLLDFKLLKLKLKQIYYIIEATRCSTHAISRAS